VQVADSYGQGIDGGGRWTFWFFDSTAAPLIFERALGSRVARHKFETQSAAIAEAVVREGASSYESPFRSGKLEAMITRFPRPGGAVIETHARFEWDSTGRSGDSLELGYFVHDRTTGELVRRGRVARRGAGATMFNADVSVPWGTTSLTIEGRTVETNNASQLRSTIELSPSPDGALRLSDLLLGDSAWAPDAIATRNEVRFFARSDSLYAPRAPLAVYWEVYGLGHRPPGDSTPADGADVANYRVRVRVEDAGGRPVVTDIVRALGGALGLRRTGDVSVEWEVRRKLAGRLAPELLLITTPDDRGRYRISIDVTDLADGRLAHSERVITSR
jgi:hypothetical protein